MWKNVNGSHPGNPLALSFGVSKIIQVHSNVTLEVWQQVKMTNNRYWSMHKILVGHTTEDILSSAVGNVFVPFRNKMSLCLTTVITSVSLTVESVWTNKQLHRLFF